MKLIQSIMCLLILWACASNQKETNIQDLSSEYKLLDRNPSLQHGKEWENIHNIYTAKIQKLRINPKDAEAGMTLTELFMQEARVTGEHGHYYPTALKLIENVLSNNPDKQDMQFRCLSDKASVLLSLHQFAKAKIIAHQAIKLNPYNAQIYGALVDAQIELGEYADAVVTADKMVAIRPDLRSYSRVSYLRELYGDLDGSIEAMNQAVEAGFPGYEETSWARLHLGDLYVKKGQLEMAEMQYRIILDQRKDYPFAIAALAELEIKKKNYSEAEKLLNDAISIIPEVSFYIKKAELMSLLGKKESASILAHEVISMLQDDEKAGHTMDLTYAYVYKNLLDDPKTSLRYALKEYDSRPANIEVNQYLSELYFVLGDQVNADIHKQKSSIGKI